MPCLFFGISFFILPLLFDRTNADSINSIRFLILSFLLLFSVAFLTTSLIQKPDPSAFGFLNRLIYLVCLGYVIFSCISLTQAINISEAMVNLLRQSIPLVFLLCTTFMLLRYQWSFQILIITVMASSFVLSIAGIHQYFGIAFTPLSRENLPYSTLASKNLHASLLFLSFPLVYFGILLLRRFWKIIPIATALLILINVLLSKSQSVWLTIGVASLIISFPIFFTRISRLIFDVLQSESFLQSTGVILIKLLTMLGIIALFSLSNIKDSNVTLLYRLAGYSDGGNSTPQEQYHSWSRTIQIIKDHPTIGVGSGNWKVVAPQYGIFRHGGKTEVTFWQNPGNDYLKIAAENGLGGLFLYYGVLLMALIYALRIILQAREIEHKFFAYIALLGIIGYMLISFFSNPQEQVLHPLYAMGIIACVISFYHREFPTHKRARSFPLKLTFIFILLGLALSIQVGNSRLKAERHIERAQIAQSAKYWDLAIEEYDKAGSWFYTLDPMAHPIAWHRGETNFSDNKLLKAINDYKNALEVHPFHIPSLIKLALCYKLLDSPSQANTYAQKAVELLQP